MGRIFVSDELTGYGIRWKGEWSESENYKIGDIVNYNFNTYIANNNGIGKLPTNEEYWDLGGIGEKGNKGDKGDTGDVGLNWLGEFNISTTYQERDAVSYQGSSYIAIQATVGNLPTDVVNWNSLAKKGDTGENGKTITTITNNKVGKTTTVIINGDYDNSPQSFEIEDGEGTGDMLSSTYDPQGINSDAFNRDNHTGTQSGETVTYNNAISGLIASDTQGAIDELSSNIEDNSNEIGVNSQAIANLQSASGEFGYSTPIVLTALEQIVPFNIISQSSNTNVFELNDITDSVSIKKNAPHNFSTSINFLHNTNQSRIITIRGRKLSDDSLVYERSVMTQANNGDVTNSSSATLLTIGKNGYPDSPFDLYFTIQCSDTGITVNSYNTIVSVGSSYDVDITANWGNISGTLSNQTDLQNELNKKVDGIAYPSTNGTDSYTATIPGITSYTDGLEIKVKADVANTGACTLNINGLGAKSVKKQQGTVDLIDGDWGANGIGTLVYNSALDVFQFEGKEAIPGLLETNSLTDYIQIEADFTNNEVIGYSWDYTGYKSSPLSFINGGGCFDKNNGNVIFSNGSTIYIYSYPEMVLQNTITGPGTIGDLAFDGVNLISSVGNTVYIHNGLTSTISNSFSNGSTIKGITYDTINNNLIVCDSEEIKIHNGVTSSIISTNTINNVSMPGVGSLGFDENKGNLIYFNYSTVSGVVQPTYIANGISDEIIHFFSSGETGTDFRNGPKGCWYNGTIIKFGREIFEYDFSLKQANSDSIIGIVNNSGSSGDIGEIKLKGIISGFSGLNIGVKYYLSDIPGIITADNSSGIEIGLAVSETEILIK